MFWFEKSFICYFSTAHYSYGLTICTWCSHELAFWMLYWLTTWWISIYGVVSRSNYPVKLYSTVDGTFYFIRSFTWQPRFYTFHLCFIIFQRKSSVNGPIWEQTCTETQTHRPWIQKARPVVSRRVLVVNFIDIRFVIEDVWVLWPWRTTYLEGIRWQGGKKTGAEQIRKGIDSIRQKRTGTRQLGLGIRWRNSHLWGNYRRPYQTWFVTHWLKAWTCCLICRWMRCFKTTSLSE